MPAAISHPDSAPSGIEICGHADSPTIAPMSDTNRPACLFCNQTTASTSKEHVLPHSWKKTFPSGDGGLVQIGRDRDGRERAPKEKKQVSPYDLQVKRVCRDCNGGWMREMDEAAKDMIFDLAWGKVDHLGSSQVEQLSTWCTKAALMRTHLERGRGQVTPLELTHRFYAERRALGQNTVQVARVLDTDSALSGHIVRELRQPSKSPEKLGERTDCVFLVMFQIGQLFFQVGLSTSSEWSKREMRSLLAVGRRNRTDRIHVLRSGEAVSLRDCLAQPEVLDVMSTCRMAARVSAHQETQRMSDAVLGTARGRRISL